MILYIHLWSVNIILLMFILGAIGYILNQQKQQYIISTSLIKYFNYVFCVTIIRGLYMNAVNSYWISFPKFIIKISVVMILAAIAIKYRQSLHLHSNLRSIVIIALFIMIYSISLLIGSYY